MAIADNFFCSFVVVILIKDYFMAFKAFKRTRKLNWATTSPKFLNFTGLQRGAILNFWENEWISWCCIGCYLHEHNVDGMVSRSTRAWEEYYYSLICQNLQWVPHGQIFSICQSLGYKQQQPDPGYDLAAGRDGDDDNDEKSYCIFKNNYFFEAGIAESSV